MVLWFWPSVRLSCRMIRFTSDKDRHVPLWSFCCPTTFWRLKVNGTNAKIFLAILLQMLWFTSGKDQKVLLLPHFILVKFKMFLDGPFITLLHFRGWKINWQKWLSLAVTVPHTIQFTSRRDPFSSVLLSPHYILDEIMPNSSFWPWLHRQMFHNGSFIAIQFWMLKSHKIKVKNAKMLKSFYDKYTTMNIHYSPAYFKYRSPCSISWGRHACCVSNCSFSCYWCYYY